MKIHCNAGVAVTNLVGDLPGYGTVWYHPKGIANILSLSRVAIKHRVTFDSTAGNEFVVHKGAGSTRRFKQSERGLYYMDVSEVLDANEQGTTTDANKAEAVLVNMVDYNKSKYSRRDYEKAVLARKIQKTLFRPSTADFIRIVEKNQLPNCPIGRKDILAAEDIFGPDVGSLKGKTPRTTQDQVEVPLIDLPPDLAERYKDVTLSVDVMKVNGIPFLMSLS